MDIEIIDLTQDEDDEVTVQINDTSPLTSLHNRCQEQVRKTSYSKAGTYKYLQKIIFREPPTHLLRREVLLTTAQNLCKELQRKQDKLLSEKEQLWQKNFLLRRRLENLKRLEKTKRRTNKASPFLNEEIFSEACYNYFQRQSFVDPLLTETGESAVGLEQNKEISRSDVELDDTPMMKADVQNGEDVEIAELNLRILKLMSEVKEIEDELNKDEAECSDDASTETAETWGGSECLIQSSDHRDSSSTDFSD